MGLEKNQPVKVYDDNWPNLEWKIYDITGIQQKEKMF